MDFKAEAVPIKGGCAFSLAKKISDLNIWQIIISCDNSSTEQWCANPNLDSWHYCLGLIKIRWIGIQVDSDLRWSDSHITDTEYSWHLGTINFQSGVNRIHVVCIYSSSFILYGRSIKLRFTARAMRSIFYGRRILRRTEIVPDRKKSWHWSFFFIFSSDILKSLEITLQSR